MTQGVIDNVARSRYELAIGGSIAFVAYRRIGKLRVLTHAEVPPALRGRGIAAQLTAGVLDLVRGQDESVQARCFYVADFIARHTQYRDLLAKP